MTDDTDTQVFKFYFSKSYNKPWLTEGEATLEQLESVFNAHEERADKDGFGFVPAVMKEPYRSKANVSAITMLVYDVDGAYSLEGVKQRVEEAGYPAFVYTTHNHLNTYTLIPTDKYGDFVKNQKLMTNAIMEDGRGRVTSKTFDSRAELRTRHATTTSLNTILSISSVSSSLLLRPSSFQN